MATIKVSIKDKDTLELQQDAKKGDIIDLRSLDAADVSYVTDAVKLAARNEVKKELEVTRLTEIENAKLQHEKEITSKFQLEIESLKAEKQASVAAAQSVENRLKQMENEKTQAIQNESEKNELKIKEVKAKLEQEKTQATVELEKEKIRLEGELGKKSSDHKNEIAQINERHAGEIKQRDAEIKRIEEYKAKRDIKSLGNDLEEHCEIEFNKIRATAYPNAVFKKDSDASSGTKGDYIFRNFEEDVDYVSIMFDMKDEKWASVNKKKNVDHLEKLDKDRKNKKCEYAVLISTLEAESELYDGITDVGHIYPKMYVVRPSNFITIINLLTTTSKNALSFKKQLWVEKNKQIDIENFERKLSDFQEDVNRNVALQHGHFEEAINQIDKSIADLQKAKDKLLASGNQMRLANNKIQDLSIKKLTHGNPTMAQKFKEIQHKNKTEKTI